MNFCQWCAGDPGDHHPECPFGRAEKAERERDEAGPVLEAARILDRECQPSPIKAISIPGPLSLMRLFDALHKHDAARAAEGGGDE